MVEVIKMPLMSDTMEEGVVSKWHVKVGDAVKPGQLLADIETDKATNEFESFWSGTLLYIGVEEGKAVPVGAVLAVIGEKGEDFKSALEAAQAEAPAQSTAAKAEGSSESVSAPPSTETTVAEEEAVAAPPADGNGRTKASPLAKKMAKERGIDLGSVTGSGDDGRIIKRDIEAIAGGAKPTRGFVEKESHKDVEVSQMRKTIAKRLVQSKFTAPHYYLTMEINMDRAADARKSIIDATDVKVSLNDMIMKACALALRQHPNVNASWLDGRDTKGQVTLRYYQHIHIGMAVAVDEGLIVPVIKFADGKPIQEIAVESKALAEKARNKQLQPEEYTGNTFTVSNLGMMDIEEFTAIINPPDSCIMAVGRVKETPIVVEGQIRIAQVMKVTLSCDHRVVDGASGARFLQTFKRFMEEPIRMFV